MSDLEQKQPFQTYFNKNIWLMRLSGLWYPLPNQGFREKVLFRAYGISILVFLAIYQPAETLVMFVIPDFETLLRSLRDQINHFGSWIKTLIWLVNRKRMLRLMDVLRDPAFTYATTANHFSVQAIIHKHHTETTRWMWLFFGFVNSICFSMLVMVFYVFIFQSQEQYTKDANGDLVYSQPLAVILLTPFPRNSRISFVLHFFFELTALVLHGWMIVALDSLCTSILSCLSAHLEILCHALKTIRPRCMERLNITDVKHLHDPPALQEEMQVEMRKCVIHLNMLLEVSSIAESIYHLQTGWQVMISLFEMCLCLYLLSESLDQSMAPELTYLVSTTFQLLLYCWFGNSLTESSNQLTSSIYEGDWISSQQSFKTSMLITMIRMQRPIYISIAKFTPLTFTTFISMARVAYSFFTALKSDAIT